MRGGIALMRRVAGVFGGFAVVLLAAGAAWGQEQTVVADGGVAEARRFDSIRLMQDGKPAPTVASGSSLPATKPVKPAVHKFWDTQNILLFAGVGVARGLDYSSTLNMRRRGNNEVLLTNAIVDDHPEFAAIEAATAAASVGLSYIFHATGHHKLERWTSYVHIGVTVVGAGRNYALKTEHPGT
jgi:hypothetical protein